MTSSQSWPITRSWELPKWERRPDEQSPFRGKVIAITGGLSGIGYATAMYLAHRGAIVEIFDIYTDRQRDAKIAIEDSRPRHCCGGRRPVYINVVEGDVKSSTDLRDWKIYLNDRHKGIDGLVNSAGVFYASTINNAHREEGIDLLDINLWGVINTLRWLAPFVNVGGSIVNLTNQTGRFPTPLLSTYSVAASGVIGLTKCAAQEYGKRDIRVNAVATGLIRGRGLDRLLNVIMDQGWGHIWDEDRAPIMLGRYGRRAEVAPLVAFLLSDESEYITAQVIGCDGGWGTPQT